MFVNFENPDDDSIEAIKQGIEASKAAAKNNQYHKAEEVFALDFIEFIFRTLRNLNKAPSPTGKNLVQFTVGFDPHQNKELFLQIGWNELAKNWGFTETPASYFFTMSTLIKYLRKPDQGKFRILSLGSGVGLYETYLAMLLNKSGIQSKFICMDFSPGMTREHQKVIDSLLPRPINIQAVTGNMSDIKLPDKSVDCVICNNSLQWCVDWKKAIQEMARVIYPNRAPYLYLFIHYHKEGMTVRNPDGSPILELPRVSPEEVMDELEKNNFDICNSRQMEGAHGTGQGGAGISRVFIMAKLTPEGLEKSWREKHVKVMGAGFY